MLKSEDNKLESLFLVNERICLQQFVHRLCLQAYHIPNISECVCNFSCNSFNMQSYFASRKGYINYHAGACMQWPTV
uniref:Uncharacterized protein n=1 Tax=Oryza brachyantha TaxID=4533 RepID=J3LWX7_ORYBR